MRKPGLRQRVARRYVHLSVLAAAAGALLTASSAQAATVTVGSPLTAAFSSSTLSGNPGTYTNSVLKETGANVVSPVDGTVVRWRITKASGGPFKLRVLTQAGGATYTGISTSAPQAPTSTATQTFSTNLPIQAGQAIGLDTATNSDQLGSAINGGNYTWWNPPLADGETRLETGAAGFELGFNADVQPLPSVSSISPSSGSTSGGTTVTINGQNLEGTTAVSFGATPPVSFTVLSDNVITAVTRASSAGTVDVTVKNPGQSPTSAADRFTFAMPTKPVTCVVPKLKGKTLKAARKALKKAHCKLGKVKGHKGKKARIKKQKPKPGTVLARGAKVRVTTKVRRK